MSTENTPPRYGRLAGIIDIRRLERETGKLLWLGFAVSVALHSFGAVILVALKPGETVPKPMSVELIIRPPRQRKPFTLVRPIPGRRLLTGRRQAGALSMHGLPDRFSRRLTDTAPSLRDSLNVDIAGVYRMFRDFSDDRDRREILPPVEVRRNRPPGIPDMVDEMINIQDLDYGKYRSMVLKDIFDRSKVEGFVHIPVSVWSAQLKPLDRPVIGLAEALKKYTGIVPTIDKRLLLTSQSLFDYPFIYICTDEEFELTPAEREAFTKYLKNGGFALLDNGFPQEKYGDAEAALRKMLADVKVDVGSSAFVGMLPNDHPVYHTFFDFNGPPLGAELNSSAAVSGKTLVDREYHPDLYLEGLWIGTRLAAIYSDKGYGLLWMQIGNNEPQQKFGVNLVVYALTHEGGINRLQAAPETPPASSRTQARGVGRFSR